MTKQKSISISVEERALLEKNINKIYLYKFFILFLLLMPVVVPFFQANNLGMRGVYLLQSVFAVTIFVFEIPSGYISDLLGRKQTLIFASLLRGIGFTALCLSQDLYQFIIAEIILGIAVSLHSGTDTALIYDTLESLDKARSQTKVLGRSISFASLGESLASLLTSLLLLVHFSIDHIAYISAFTSWITFFISFTIYEPPRVKMGKKHRENFKYIFEKLFKQNKLLNLIILNSILSSAGTLIAVWLFQKYWTQVNIPIVYFGFLWASTNFIVFITSRYAHKIEKQFGSFKFLFFLSLLPIFGYMGIGLIDSALGILACYLFKVCRGFGQVLYRDALNKRVAADFRATANSVCQMGVRIVFILVGPVVGHLVDSKSITYASLTMAFLYALIFIFAVIPLLKERKSYIKIN